MGFSVIIITLNRLPVLRRCLEALVPQLEPDDEVIIVSASDPVVEKELAAMDGRIRIVSSERRNMPHQRNLGIAATGHPLIAFIDDDAMTQSGWRAALEAPYADARVASVVGKVIVPGYEHLRNLTAALPDGKLDWVDTARLKETASCPVFNGQGCNMSFRRTVFDGIGGFDENFIVIASGEEADVFMRMHAAGLLVMYAPDAAVLHEFADPSDYERSDHDARSMYYRKRNYTYLLTKHYFPGPKWRKYVFGDFFKHAFRCWARLGRVFINTIALTAANLAAKVAGVRAGLRARKTEDGRRKTEDGRRKTEDGRRKTEDHRPWTMNRKTAGRGLKTMDNNQSKRGGCDEESG